MANNASNTKAGLVAQAQKKKKAQGQPWNKSTMSIEPIRPVPPTPTVVDPFKPGAIAKRPMVKA